MIARAFAALSVAAALAAQGGTRAETADGPRPAERCRELVALQLRGELDVATVLQALGDDDETVGATAAAIVRHALFELPPALLQGADADARAARRLLVELAWAPRPAAESWADAWSRAAPGRSPDDRCLALAARGRELGAPDVDLLFETLREGTAGDGWRLAVALLPPARADGLAGRLHALLLADPEAVGRIVPLCDRMSPRGVQQLLGVAVALPPAAGEELCRQIAARDVELVRERARAMLDGEAPIEALWLDHSAPLLDSDARRERLFAVLEDGKAPRELQRRAFATLLEAGIASPRVVRWARAGAAEDQARLVDAAVATLPEGLLVDWLEGEPAQATRTLRALVRRPTLGPAIEDCLLRPFATGGSDGPFLGPAATVLVMRGSEAAIRQVWPQLRGSTAWGEHVDLLARRGGAFAHELLLRELDAPAADGVDAAARERQLDEVRLGLLALGDRRQLGELARRAGAAVPTFVRRCAHHARQLPREFAEELLRQLPGVEDPELAAELLAWAATCGDGAVRSRLREYWSDAGDDERSLVLREVALRALATGPERDGLVADWRAAVASGPVPEALAAVPFELIATMSDQLGGADLQLLAELALLPPLTDPEHERALTARWPDGRSGFPSVAAVAQRLLGADARAAGRAFAAVAAAVDARPDRDGLSRVRLLVLWRSLLRDRAVLHAVGAATAPLFLHLPAAGPASGTGVAHWFQQRAAADRGDFAAAAGHARSAAAELLWCAEDRHAARAFLGERDPAAGDDPWAALAAAANRYDHAVARANGDAAAADLAARRVREFAGHDADARAAVPPPTDADPNR